MTPSAACPLCHSPSEPLAIVADHFFGSPGTWRYHRCAALGCGAAFPSPAPTKRELEIAYSSYYTHGEGGGLILPGRVEAWLSRSTKGRSRRRSPLPLFGWLAEQVSWELGGLAARPGLIVDIGAGDGVRLGRLRRAGWSLAQGIEPDPAAVEAARAAGFDVRRGSAEALPVDDETADAAVMHHVIEHVSDPRKALSEALRVLKKGGELSVITPNIDSSGRAKWGEFWRGFEAPRHLTIFTTAALESAAREAGFEPTCIRTTARSAAWVDAVSGKAAGSRAISAGRLGRVLRADRAFRAQARSGGERGEEIVFLARKP